MKKTEKLLRLVFGSLFVASLFVNTGCSKDPVLDNGNGSENSSENNGTGNEDKPAGVLNLKWESEVKEDTPFMLFSGGETSLVFKAENAKSVSVKDTPENWEINIDSETSTVKVKAPVDGQNLSFDLTLIAKGEDNSEKEVKTKIVYTASFDDPKGAFVLNEGNMTTENGSLTYITPEGFVIDDAYKAVNGTELGNVCQDMAFCNGKIYIISQNGDENAVGAKFENDGMLVVLDAKTLKKEKAFSKSEMSVLDWPTHIAVLDESHVYIRDNKGIYRFDTNTKELKFIEGSEGAPKSKFVVMDGKVYTIIDGYISKLLEITTDNDIVNKITLPYDAPYKDIYSIYKSDDGKIWLSAFGFGKYYIGKYSLDNNTIVSRQISVMPNLGASGVAFVAKGNDIYYASGTTIYTLKFDENPDLGAESGLEEEKVLCDLNSLDNNAKELYNGLGINQSTGTLYVNTIKGVGPFYTTNSIWEFDLNGNWTAPKNKYDNYTNFPAGFFFTGNN